MFEDGKPKLRSHCGVVFGLIMVIIIFLYAYMRGEIMLNYGDNTIQEPVTENYFDKDYIYDTRDGFRVAFYLTAYDSTSDQAPLDDSYGQVNAYLKTWGE